MSRRLLPIPRHLALSRETIRFAPPFTLHFTGRARPLERILLELFHQAGPDTPARDLAIDLGNDLGLAWGRGPFLGILLEAKRSLDRIETRWPESAYAVEIAPHAVAAVSHGRPGLFYAVQTLLQLRGRDGAWPCGSIADAPELGWRGLLWDVSRGQVPALETLKALVDLLAALKMNLLTFNLEHTFAYVRHPAIGRGHDPLTPEEIRALVDYAQPRQVEVAPAQQSLGHLYHLLKLPEYRRLAYDPEKLWSLDPAKPESYRLLEELYEELIPCFDSAFFNVCCDEPFDLARRYDPSRFAGRTFPQVLLEHLLRLKDILDLHGKTMMVWGDMLLAHPELLAQIPKDVIVLDWQYGSGALEGPEHYRKTIEPIAGAGLQFLTCTCTWNLMKIFTNLDLLAQNHRAFVPEGIAAGSVGNIVTHWGDLGHMSLLGPTLPALALAAEWSWSGRERSEPDLTRAYSWAVFGDGAGRAGKLMRRLHEVNRILAGPVGLGDVGFLVFFDEPLAGDLIRGVPDPGGKATELLALADQAHAELQELLALNLKNSRWLCDLELPLAQIRVLAAKLSLLARFQDDYPGLAEAGPERVEEVLSGLIQGYRELPSLIQAAAEALTRRWLDQAKRSDLDLNLARYDRLGQAGMKRAGQFEKILQDFRSGAPLPLLALVRDAPEFAEFRFDALKEMGIKHLLAGSGA